eukprot:2833787-Alexandrium_andersonii.AAC.1
MRAAPVKPKPVHRGAWDSHEAAYLSPPPLFRTSRRVPHSRSLLQGRARAASACGASATMARPRLHSEMPSAS